MYKTISMYLGMYYSVIHSGYGFLKLFIRPKMLNDKTASVKDA
jgi:hypothetical protein